MSWRGNLGWLAGLGLLMFAIATGFALQGLWLVVPFAGAELLAVAAGLYVVCRRLARSEVISVLPQAVRIETGHRRPETSLRVPRQWLRVELRDGHTRAYPSRLFIRSHRRAVEVGAALTDAERRRLAGELRRLLAQSGEPVGW